METEQIDLTAKGTPFWVEDGGDHFFIIDGGAFALVVCDDPDCDCEARAKLLATGK